MGKKDKLKNEKKKKNNKINNEKLKSSKKKKSKIWLKVLIVVIIILAILGGWFAYKTKKNVEYQECWQQLLDMMKKQRKIYLN